jgi:molybdopterin-containing oxidoreductase family membrane subunit
VKYALFLNIFFFGCEIFVAGYSQIPDHLVHLKYLFFGYHGHTALVPWMWTSMFLMVVALILLLPAITRENETVLLVTCILVFVGTWIDKGFGLITGGFVPNQLHQVHEYMPSLPEVAITVAIWCIGLLILTVLYKIAVTVKEEVQA